MYDATKAMLVNINISLTYQDIKQVNDENDEKWEQIHEFVNFGERFSKYGNMSKIL